MKIVIIANICIDKNTTEKSTYETAGSPAMFMTRIFKQLPNTSVTIVSHYGEDFLKYLNGIKIYPSTPGFNKTLEYNNISQKKGRRIQKAFNRKNSPPIKVDRELKKIIQESDILLFTPLLPNFPFSYISEVRNETKKGSLKILSPQGYFRDFDKNNKVIFRKFKEANKILPNFNFVILSEEDYPDVEKEASEWVKNNGCVVIITKAERGATFLSKKERVDIPTKPVCQKDIVDSTGSGDIFGACFAYKYFECKNIVESIKYAHKIAGYCLKFTPDQINLNSYMIV